MLNSSTKLLVKMGELIAPAILSLFIFSTRGNAMEGTLPLPRHRLVYENLILLRYNSMGGEALPAISYRLRLFNKTGPMWEDAHVGIGFQPTVNFSQTRLGPLLTIKPIGFLSFTAAYYYNLWYGTFGNLRSYQNPGEDYFVPDDFSGDEDAYSSSGHEVQLGARITAALGPFVFSNLIHFYWTQMTLRGGDLFYFQPRHDVVVQNNGWFFTNDTDVGYILPMGLTAAARFSVVHAIYTEQNANGEENTPTMRLGPLISYTFFDEAPGHFNKPTLLFMSSWWLRNRYRTGEGVRQGVPLLVIALKFEGDIWWRD